MTTLNYKKIRALPLDYFTSILGTEITGKKSMFIGGQLIEECKNKKFLITGIIGQRLSDKLIGYSLYIEGIDNGYELDTSLDDAFSHFFMPNPHEL